jgi:transposase
MRFREMMPLWAPDLRPIYPAPSDAAVAAVKIRLRWERRSSRCPLCGQPSGRVHSRYGRTVADLPLRGVPVILRVRARRIFCDNPTCKRKTFCERLLGVAAPTPVRRTGWRRRL